MHPRLQAFIAIILVFLSANGVANAKQTNPSPGVTLVSPAACPSGGCAAGQRLNLNAQFNLGQYDAGNGGPNVVVCFYTPSDWAVSDLTTNPKGGLNQSYTFEKAATAGCDTTATPSGYDFLGRARTNLSPGSSADSLSFAFRIGSVAKTNGSVLIKVYDHEASGWTQQLDGSLALPVTQTSGSVFAASDAAACGSSSPCYVNSADDGAGGIGSGLKDAIDALPDGAKVQILGNLPIKENSVAISHPITLQGLNNASLVTSATACAQPMLDVQAAVLLQNLTISASGCAAPRDLIHVNTNAAVVLESNDLISGADAIRIPATAANIILRFNQIKGNSGYAVNLAGGSSHLLLTANNIFGNNPGKPQIECSQVQDVTLSHNFWGSGVLPSQTTSNCQSVDDSARLGAPVQHNSSAPGVDVRELTVTSGKTYTSDELVAAKHPQGENNFNLYLVNHGSAGLESIPFLNGGQPTLSACSNYWDVFIKNGANLSGNTSLDLFFKYGTNPVCQSTIESINYCNRISPGPLVPLWWYDLSSAQWLLTSEGNNPAVTRCHTDLHELHVTLAGGRPGFPSGLRYTPFVVGLENQPSSINLSSFSALASDSAVRIQWQTAAELNTSGFYLQRASTILNGQFDFHSLPSDSAPKFFPALGSGQSGGSYEYQDSGVSNGTTYYYRLQIIAHDGSLKPFGTAQAAPFAASPTPTITPTFTPSGSPTTTPTFTVTPSPTATGSRTVSVTPTGSVTATRTKSVTPSRTPSRTPSKTSTYAYSTINPIATRTPSRTPTYTGSRTATSSTGSGYPEPNQTGAPTGASNGSGGYPGPGTPAANPSQATQGTAGSNGYPETNGTPAPGSPTAAVAAQQPSAQVTGTAKTNPTASAAAPTPPNQAIAKQLWRNLGIGGLIAALLVSIAGWVIFISRGIR